MSENIMQRTNELFRASRKVISIKGFPFPDQFTTRTTRIIMNAFPGESDPVKLKEKLMEAVTTGKVWMWRNCGNKSVREICEWLAKQEAKK